MYTFGPLIAKNSRSGRLLGGAPVTVTTLDGVTLTTTPTPLVTNHEGYLPAFTVDTDQRVILARPRGGDPLPLYAHEGIQDAAEAADTINTGRLSEDALTSTIGSAVDERVPDELQQGEDDRLRVHDQTGQVALEVDNEGTTWIGETAFTENGPRWRIHDGTHIAFEVDENGRTHIYDPADDSGTTVTTLHVFLAAGQSNMSGRGQPVQAPLSPRVMQYGATRRVLETATVPLDMHDTPTGTSPATFFAHNYLGTQPAHVGVLLVPAARGGTGFAGTPANPVAGYTWTKGAAQDPAQALYDLSVVQVQEAIAAAKAAGYMVVLKGVLWHQGENNSGPTYATRLDDLIGNYRADLGDPALPFLVGQMVPEGIDNTPGRPEVDQQHQDTPHRTPRTGFAKATRDGHNPGDLIHFSTLGTTFLGDTYTAAYYQALGNVHPH